MTAQSKWRPRTSILLAGLSACSARKSLSKFIKVMSLYVMVVSISRCTMCMHPFNDQSWWYGLQLAGFTCFSTMRNYIYIVSVLSSCRKFISDLCAICSGQNARDTSQPIVQSTGALSKLSSAYSKRCTPINPSPVSGEKIHNSEAILLLPVSCYRLL